MLLKMVLSSKQPLLSQSHSIGFWIRQTPQVKTLSAVPIPGTQMRQCVKVLPLIMLAMLLTTFYCINEDLIQIPDFQLQSSSRELESFTSFASASSSIQCRVPDLDPFHPALMKLLPAQSLVECSYDPLTRAVYNLKTDTYVLEIINEQLAKMKLSKKQQKSFSCCFYQIVSETNKDGGFKRLGKVCTKFNQNVTISYRMEMIHVDCTVSDRKKRKSIYQDVHATATRRKTLGDKIKEAQNETVNSSSNPNINSTFNVLLVGVDSVSYAHFRRQLPLTHELIRNNSNNWIEFKSYNKVGENTLPNLMPLLTGQSLRQIEKSCWHGNKDYFDACPFLWKNFSSHNYVTMYAEDEPKISSFNYLKKGFKKRPTDYYARAYLKSAEDLLKTKHANGLNFCLGPTTSVDRILQFSLDFIRQSNDTRFFGLSWLNSMTHNSLNNVHLMDKIMVDYFNTLSNLGRLNDTIIVFFSDHGIRFGKFRQTFFGWFEERLPFLFFHVPDKFRELYPDQVKNLVENADKLTTPYEIYLTLNKVLNMSSEVQSKGCPKCRGLFEPVDPNRSCEDAGIPFDWCVCGEFVPESTNGPEVKSVGQELVDEVNRISFNKSDDRTRHCARFKMEQVVSARKIINSKHSSDVAFQIIVKTTPGKAIFEATVSESPELKVLGSISRLDSYAHEGDCTHSAVMRKYCYCVRDKGKS